MIFLLEYDRPNGKLVSIQRFDDSLLESAQDARLERELELHRNKILHELVLLEASSEEALRLTHRRYFETLGQIAAHLKTA